METADCSGPLLEASSVIYFLAILNRKQEWQNVNSHSLFALYLPSRLNLIHLSFVQTSLSITSNCLLSSHLLSFLVLSFILLFLSLSFGGRSVGIVRSRTQTMEFSFISLICCVVSFLPYFCLSLPLPISEQYGGISIFSDYVLKVGPELGLVPLPEVLWFADLL
jgi:hypothetical protein